MSHSRHSKESTQSVCTENVSFYEKIRPLVAISMMFLLCFDVFVGNEIIFVYNCRDMVSYSLTIGLSSCHFLNLVCPIGKKSFQN
jgi:hypothetical protein